MHPWLLAHPPISTYGVCLVAAFVSAWLWGRRRAGGAGLDPSRFDLMMPLLLAAGLLGAWLGGIATDALTGEAAHGAVLLTSLLGGTVAGIAYARLIRLPLGILGDMVAPPLALGIGIGRIGCFLAGCCFGKVCESPGSLTSLRFPAGSFAALAQGTGGASLPVYPVQLYESALCIGLAALLAFWPRGDRGVTGQRFLSLAIAYAGLRFTLEFLRADNPALGGLTFSQWTAMAVTLAAALTWGVRLGNARRWRIALSGGGPWRGSSGGRPAESPA